LLALKRPGCNAAVTVVHTGVGDLATYLSAADIIVAAAGSAGLVKKEMVKPGAAVVDVGMNTVTDEAEFRRFFAGNTKREEAFRKKGSVLIGDVHPEVAEVAGAMTPVPGGVGPLTIAMLMFNTVKAAKMRRSSGQWPVDSKGREVLPCVLPREALPQE